MTHKLLLADDSATIQRVIELTFSGEDVQVLAVGDGEQAIARIPTEHPDIVLADIGMPKRSGYDVAAFVKSTPDLQHIPVLLLAGAFEPVDEARAEQVGCDGVLVKPFEPQHVIARVRELLEGAKGTPTRATADVARPVERFTAPRPLEFPRREEPRPAPVPEPQPPPTVDASLDDYFDRLDAAFATMDASPARPADDRPEGVGPDDRLDLPTLDDILRADFAAPPAPIDLPLHQPATAPATQGPVTPPTVEPPDTTPTLAPRAAEPIPARSQGRSLLADAFTALLALEEGDPAARPVRLTTANPQPAQMEITDAMIDELAQRVIDRLAPGAAQDLVARVVSEVAERLVRQEIERIRNGT